MKFLSLIPAPLMTIVYDKCVVCLQIYQDNLIQFLKQRQNIWGQL